MERAERPQTDSRYSRQILFAPIGEQGQDTLGRSRVAIVGMGALGTVLANHMAEYDLILTPTLTQPPALLGFFSTNDDFRSFRRKVARYTTFLAVINASGQPAASLPLHWSADGLPIGVQLIGRFGRDAELLQISHHLEIESEWGTKSPPLIGYRFTDARVI